MENRVCDNCGVLITACMGFVNTEDFLKRISDGLTHVRELCGRCVLKRDDELSKKWGMTLRSADVVEWNTRCTQNAVLRDKGSTPFIGTKYGARAG